MIPILLGEWVYYLLVTLQQDIVSIFFQDLETLGDFVHNEI